MGDQRNELYRNGGRNSEIAASAKETFAQSEADREATAKHGSFNKLTILNNGSAEYDVRLDGLTEKTWRVPSTGSFEIHPKEGLFFNFIEILNPSASDAISADDLTLTWAVSVEVL